MENKTVIKIHIAFWIISSGVSFLHILAYLSNPMIIQLVFGIFISILCNAFTFYIFYFLVRDNILNKKRIFFLIFFEFAFLAVFSLVYCVLYVLPYVFTLTPDNPVKFIIENGIRNRIYIAAAYIASFSILGILSRVTLLWYRNQLKKKDLEKQNIANELAMLKVQINPHFLFNTMNNIKSLINSRPSKAITSIDKLKGIMHYMVFDSSSESVLLAEEVRHINNYLELEKIRFSDPGFIDFKITGDYGEINIPPLIFMPFIENAFKHGNRLATPPGITIRLDVIDDRIDFEVSNSVNEFGIIRNGKSGFGLANICRRLDLLFGEKYKLEISNKDKEYSVKLYLNLK
ncbi:MAG: histidine kinase [Ignavibacteriae bacterium]|nr:histidine kinase [Ignavibacteriota bacterium]